ncbi:MAG: S4 domain-containing protein, partial [Tuberibacillus sp.]
YFKDVFQRNSLPENMPIIKWSGEKQKPIVDLLVELKLLESKSAARKMIQNEGVRLNQIKVSDMNFMVNLEEGLVVQVGKRKINQITLK